MSEQKIHLTETPPVRCSSCFGQYPDRRHVDFGAAWDGPTFPVDTGEVAGGKFVAIDDLIVCDECLTAAANLIGLDEVEREREEIQRLKEREQELVGQLKLALSGAQGLEQVQADLNDLADMLTKPKSRARKVAA